MHGHSVVPLASLLKEQLSPQGPPPGGGMKVVSPFYLISFYPKMPPDQQNAVKNAPADPADTN